MEIYIDVWVNDSLAGKSKKANEGIYTFVAVDQSGRPVEVPQLKPETEEERERYASALRRKQLSLILSKKMHPKDATELKALFLKSE